MHRLCIVLATLTFATPLGVPSVAATQGPHHSLEVPNRALGVRGGLRIRPHDNRIAAILLKGLERSGTLRALVERIEQGNVIVYLQMQPSLKDHLAGTMTFLASTERFRYVRVCVNPGLNSNAAIATLGHELQHVLEVANEPSIVDAASLGAFYRKAGVAVGYHSNGFDTAAARIAGDEAPCANNR